MVIKGEDIPTEYVIKGVATHEIPVIGTFVDKRVVPGFKYKVRLCQSSKYLFDGKALMLADIGRGYGKRLTFKDISRNRANNYFWSDNHAEGYAFSFEVLTSNTTFYQKDTPQLVITIQSVSPNQQEIDTKCIQQTEVQKRVQVQFTCDTYLGPITSKDISLIGEALIVRSTPKSEAKLINIYITKGNLAGKTLLPFKMI